MTKRRSQKSYNYIHPKTNNLAKITTAKPLYRCYRQGAMKKLNRKANTAKSNGAKSQGPITPEGKAAARQNAIKHGLLSSKLFVLQNEKAEDFAAYIADMVELYNPANSLEIDLLVEMVGARWRLRRLWAMEAGTFELAVDAQYPDLQRRAPDLPENARLSLAFGKIAADDKALSLAVRYEARIRRSFERAHADLLRIQKIRLEAEAEANAEERPRPNPSPPSALHLPNKYP